MLPVLQTQYDANSGNYKDYTELLREGGYVYLAKCGDSAAFAVTADTLKDWIITLFNRRMYEESDWLLEDGGSPIRELL